MPEHIGQAIARERLRARLVDLRKQRRLSSDAVTARTHWSASKLHRIETGAVTVQPVDVQALLGIYEVRDSAEVSRLTDLAVIARRRQWWSGFQLDNEYRDFVAYENEATHITVYQALQIPALLQTPAYARAVTSSVAGKKPDDHQLQNLIDVRMRRQSELLARMRGGEPPELVAILDGAVLERRIGGSEVLAGQLDHLVEMSHHDHIRLVVVPLRNGVHPSLGGVFELLEFEGTADPDVVLVESPVKAFLVKDGELTARFHDAVDSMLEGGLTRDAAVEEIRRIRDRL
jgi:Domain of unknown function (DUF5753)/Helix-turn-helix domain